MCQAYNDCHLKRRHDVRVEEQRYILFSSSASLLTVTDYKSFWSVYFNERTRLGRRMRVKLGQQMRNSSIVRVVFASLAEPELVFDRT